MNVKSISRTVGLILLITGIFQLFPLLIAVIDHEPRNILAYIESLCLILLVGSALLLFSRGGNRMFSAQEGFAATGLSWIFMSAFGALPFFLSGQIPSYVDAFFEMVSGFTTTGASILTDVEALSRCNLFWRSFSHWLGGMGVLVFLLAVVPGARKNGGTGIYLMRAESPGPSVDKLTPHLRQTAMILYGIYILLTALCIGCLLLGGMPVFDSFCIAFGTAGTGGFAIKNSSMGGYSCFLQTVVTVFMFLFGVNFSLYYMLLLRKFKAVFKNEELRLYFGIAAGSIVLIAINISRMYNTVYESVHHAAFHDHNGLRHGRFRAVAGVFQSNPAFAHVHRRQRRQHGRRSQGLPCFAPDEEHSPHHPQGAPPAPRAARLYGRPRRQRRGLRQRQRLSRHLLRHPRAQLRHHLGGRLFHRYQFLRRRVLLQQHRPRL